MRKVHVVFKTHLDIGYTDFAANVTQRYMEDYIPKALSLAESLASSSGYERFVWTTGSWLIWKYLEEAKTPDRHRMEDAIEKGHIAWHGLPFTMHSELLDESLFCYGLSLSQRLDKRFGRKTIAAKMTDVPGHSLGIVRPMAEAGLRYLHIGVNPASPMPEVPPLFRWRSPEGSEILVNYAGSYGSEVALPGHDEVLVFAHSGDNCGPPSAEEIGRQFAKISAHYPGDEIRASTLDAFAASLDGLCDRLPLVEEELGDTWIHGAATDPRKLARYRECLRLRRKWIAEGGLDSKSVEFEVFSSSLLMVAEHTWGLDIKKYLPDYSSYNQDNFVQARRRDLIDPDAVPEKYRYISSFAMDELDSLSAGLFTSGSRDFRYSRLEESWEEQRAYIDTAVAALAPERRTEADAALADIDRPLEPTKIRAEIFFRPGDKIVFGSWIIVVDENGGIRSLVDSSGREWAKSESPTALFSYEIYGIEDCERWLHEYRINVADTHRWSDSDFGKPGYELSDPPSRKRRYLPIVSGIFFVPAPTNAVAALRLELRMPEEAVAEAGAPECVVITHCVCREGDCIETELYWCGKAATRKPEGAWFSFDPAVANESLWRMEKLGMHVSPLAVVRGGGRNLHAIGKDVSYSGADCEARIESLDAALLSPGRPRLYEFDRSLPDLRGGMHFNLLNNKWGTNFPIWYEEDAKFRFRLILKSHF